MPKVNVDELTEKLFDPIELTFEGKEYKITVLPSEILDTLMATLDNPSLVRKSFAEMVSVDEKLFKKTDFRKIAVATGAIMKEVRKQITAYTSKNGQGESVVPKQ